MPIFIIKSIDRLNLMNFILLIPLNLYLCACTSNELIHIVYIFLEQFFPCKTLENIYIMKENNVIRPLRCTIFLNFFFSRYCKRLFFFTLISSKSGKSFR